MRYFTVLFLPLLIGCASTPGPAPAPVPTDTELCEAAQGNLEKVCPKLAVTPAKKPFGVYCREAQTTNNIYVNPKCMLSAKSCEEADRCPQQ